jgi:hypothetical protein
MGWDGASKHHDVSVVGEKGKVVLHTEVERRSEDGGAPARPGAPRAPHPPQPLPRRLEPLGEVTRNLQALVRSRDDHLQARAAVTNPLRALLDARWPGAIFERLDPEIALAFLEDSPTPERAARLGEKRLPRFLVRHPSSGRHSPVQLPEHPEAQVLAEVGPILDRATDVEQAAAKGASPSSRASGTSQSVSFR